MRKFAVIYISLIIIIVLSVVFIVKHEKYNEKWILGKTTEQVVERYGDFIRYVPTRSTDGQIQYYIASYTLKPRKVGFLGTYNGVLFSIKFDKDGIAFECYKELDGEGG